jgi:hypothetical protein
LSIYPPVSISHHLKPSVKVDKEGFRHQRNPQEKKSDNGSWSSGQHAFEVV